MILNRTHMAIIVLALFLMVGAGVVAMTDRHVTVTHEGEGSVSPEGDLTTKFHEGIDLDIRPAEGWHVGAILLDDRPIDYDGSYRLHINFFDLSHTHVHVVFVEDSPGWNQLLTVTSEGMGTVIPGGVSEHVTGSSVTVSAIPVEGYSIVSFIVNGVDMGPVDTYDLVMDRDHSVHVVFESHMEPYHTLIVLSEGMGTTDPIGITHHDPGEVVTVEFLPSEGWAVGSVTVDNVPVGSPDRYAVTMNDHHVIRVEFVPMGTVTLNVTSEGMGSVVPYGTSEHLMGSTVHVSTVADDGWMVSDVLVDGRSIGAPSDFEVVMTMDRHVHVVFSEVPPECHVLTITAEGHGTTIPSGVNAYEHGTIVPITALPNDGWTVLDVLVDGYTIGATDSFNVTMDRDHVVTVVFGEVPVTRYTLDVEIRGNGDVEPSGVNTYDAGTVVDITATAWDGWELDDVLVDGVSIGVTSAFDVTMDSDHSVVVMFTEIPRYSLTVTVEGNGSTDPFGVTTYQRGTLVTIRATPVTGHEVSDVKVDGVSKGPVDEFTVRMDSDHVVIVEFSPVSVMLAVSVVGNGEVVPAGGTYAYGDAVEIAATPDDGWRLSDVKVDGVSKGATSPYTVHMHGDCTVEVVFTEIRHVLTVHSHGSGTVIPNGTNEYVQGTPVTVTATPDTGWRVSDFKVDGVSKGAVGSFTVTMDDDHDVDVTFVATEPPVAQKRLIVSSAGMGSVNPSSTTSYPLGTEVTVIATPSDGWRVSDFKVDGVSKGAIASFTIIMDDDHTVDVTFTQITHTLTVEKTGSGTVSQGGTYAHGTEVTVTAVPDTGWMVSDFKVDGVSKGAIASFTIIMDDDHTVDVTFTQITHTLTVEKTGSGTVSQGGTYAYGTKVTVTAIPYTGWRISEFKVDGSVKADTSSIVLTMDRDHTVDVVFTQITHTLTVGKTGSGTASQGGTYAYGTKVTVTATPYTGWRISEFKVDGSEKADTSSIVLTMDRDHTVDVTFVKRTYTLTVTSEGYGTTSISGDKTCDYGDTVTVKATGNVIDFKVDGVSKGSINEFDILIDSDHSVHVVFEEYVPPVTQKKLTITSDGNGTVSPAPGVHLIDAGTSITVTALPDTGWTVSEFKVDGVSKGTVTSSTIIMDADHTVEVTFTEIMYTLTVEKTGNGTVSGGGVYAYGDEVTVTATPDTGWEVTDLIVDGVPKASIDEFDLVMNEDHHVKIVFTRISHTVTVTQEGYGTVTPSTGTHFHGDTASFTAEAAEGWYLDSLAVDGTVYDGDTASFTVTKDHSVHAVFLQIMYAFDVEVVGNGIVTPDADEYAHGTEFTVTATPDTGWEVSDFIVDGDSKGPIEGFDITMQSNHSVRVVFTKIQHTLTMSKEGEGSYSPLSGKYDYGTTVTFTATADEGWFIHDVIVDGDSKGAVTQHTVFMDRDHTVRIVFARTMHTLTVEHNEGGAVTHTYEGVPSQDASREYPEGVTVSFTVVSDQGYVVGDVFVDGESIGKATSFDVEVTGDRTVEVVFMLQLTVTHNDGGTVTPDGVTDHLEGSKVTVTVTPDRGYVIDAVTIDGVEAVVPSKSSYSTEILMDGNHSVDVEFIRVHTIDVVSGEGGTISPSGKVTVIEGGSCTFTLTPDDGWHVLYTVMDEGTDDERVVTFNPFTIYNVSSDHTVRAVFEKDPAGLDHITVDTSGANLVYTIGDFFDRTGLVVTAHYDDGTSYVVTGYDVSPSRFTETGVQDVTVSYNGEIAVFQVSVQPAGGVDVFVTEHNGSPVKAGTHLSGFDFDTSNMSPGDVRTISLRMEAEGATGLEAFVVLSGFIGDAKLAGDVLIDISSDGASLGSATLSEMWDGRSIDLGILPAEGLDVTISLTLRNTDDTGIMDSSVKFNLEAGAGRAIS